MKILTVIRFMTVLLLSHTSIVWSDESRSSMESEYKASCIGKSEEGLIQKYGFPSNVHQSGQAKFLMYQWFNSHSSNYCSAMFTTVDGKITNLNVAEFKNPLQRYGACAYAVRNWYGTQTTLKCD